MKTRFTLPFLLLTATIAAQAPQAPLANRDYGDLLQKSLRFFDAQACGPEVDSYSTLDWRGNCHLDDGSTVINEGATYDLTGGWHDAGDHVKFNYPLAHAVYNLAMLYVDHRDRIDATATRSPLLKHLRHVANYMIKCHPEPDKYVIQVATGSRDHKRPGAWQVPEENDYTRRVYFADTGQPNTNLACANAAAFAALSMAFRGVDNPFSDDLLQHARDLFDFGVADKRSYGANTELPALELDLYGENNDYWDEIMIGAAFLYRATNEQRYRDEFDAASVYAGLGNWAPGWGNHEYESTYQMAKATGSSSYRDRVRDYLNNILNGSYGSVSPGGMWYVGNWDSGFHLPSSLGAATIAYRYAELVGSSASNYAALRRFAFSQVNYALGDNPRNRSFVVDYGNNPPRITHHRAASDGNQDAAQDPHIITGALVMGPLGNDTYLDTRSEIKCTEPALGNNGVLALIATLMAEETNTTVTPPTGGGGGTVVVRARGNCGGETFQLRVNNKVVLTRTVTTSYTDYTYSGYSTGTVSVHFTNDQNAGCDYNLYVDYIDVCGQRIQSEAGRVVQTANWTNGDKQVLFTNGNNNYGNPGCATAGGKVVVRAKSSQGTERMRLRVDGKIVKTWEDVATAPANYTYEGYTGGNLQVVFDDDGGSGPTDRNLAVNYIIVCGTTIQSDAPGVTRSACGTDNDRGFAWLYCPGNFDFGNPGCGTAASTLVPPPAHLRRLDDTASFTVYPNPAHHQLTIVATDHYQFTLYNSGGQLVVQRQLSGTAQVDVSHLPPGVYTASLQTPTQQARKLRVIIQ